MYGVFDITKIVAPFMGAWIEICGRCDTEWDVEIVAPFMGAWIEILLRNLSLKTYQSHPLWVRGLKFFFMQGSPPDLCVAPFMGAWIEILFTNANKCDIMSHPLWVRGLKWIL